MQYHATDTLDAQDLRRVRRLDLTSLVREWWTTPEGNDGILVVLDAGSHQTFHSREVADPALRPQLILTLANGSKRYVEPTADASLAASSQAGLGTDKTLVLHARSLLALRFDLGATALRPPPRQAELVLVRSLPLNPSRSRLGVLRIAAPLGKPSRPREDGIASRYVGDKGIGSDPAVLFSDDFDRGSPADGWTPGMKVDARVVDMATQPEGEPLQASALKVRIPGKQALGLDYRYKFKVQHGREPDEVHLRYYLLLTRSWLNAIDGGKLPGLAGTYGVGGWGGRPWNGYAGWSMRGAYTLPPVSHPAHGKVMLGHYAYHSKSDHYGQHMPWYGAGAPALVVPQRWYCIEQRIKLNTPKRDDGVVQAWIDGQLVLDRTDVKWRDAPDIHIEEVWMNFFHGGTSVPREDMVAYIDAVVVARTYIGPMRR